MKISTQWLSEWVDVGDDIAALAHALTMAGLEIEGIERAAPEMSGIVVGEVLQVAKHPNADKLSVCRVSSGAEELQIVCGASNVRAGMKAPLALVGATLPNGTQIKQAKLRDVESFGMLCSAREIGIADDSSGLLELPHAAPTGQSIVAALGLDDRILEVNLTPNRGDCMSVLGIAREVAAARKIELRGNSTLPTAATTDEVYPVALESDGCRKFVGRVIRGTRGDAQSPLWLRERLRRAGLRSVSALVDVTNYVMLELGQPMHAYDLRKLKGTISIRQARTHEQLTLLDGRTVELAPDVLVVADQESVLGMAGIMGGSQSGINADTTDVFLEVAFFEPAAVAGRGRRYGLVTDASQRFERGVDPELQERAAERATQLILECAGGRAGPLTVTRGSALPKPHAILLRSHRIERVLGVGLAATEIETLLHRLGMTLERREDAWLVTPPSWRFDLAIEEDLIEEVARLYGYDHIIEVPEQTRAAIEAFTETRVPSTRLASLMVDRGYQEAITYSFTERELQQAVLPGVQGLALANPISAELAVMRVSLWPGLVQVLKNNIRRQQSRVRFFELGRTFDAAGNERDVIAGLAYGPAVQEQWGIPAAYVDFFDVKADVQSLIHLTGASAEFRFTAEKHPSLHPGQAARIYRGEQGVGWLGALNPKTAKQLDITYPVFVFELDLASAFFAKVPRYTEISRFPAIRRDLALIVAESVSFESLKDTAATTAGALLRDLVVFDVYHGPEIEKGKKSIALGFVLQDTSRTLTDEDADRIMAQVAGELQRRFNATIRDK